MTASYAPPNRHPHTGHHAPIVYRPQMTFVPQIDPVPLPALSSPTWKAGWIVSGLAVFLAVVAFSVVGAVAVKVLPQFDLTSGPGSTSAPIAPPSSGAVAVPRP